MRGFTLIEVLLSISIIGLITGLSLPVYHSFAVRNDLDVAAQNVAESLRRAQVFSRGMSGDDSWGISLQSSSIVLFKGGTYATRDPAYDETTYLSSAISKSGLSEVVFTKRNGNPLTSGTVTLTSGGDSIIVTINDKGTVIY